MNFPYLRNNKPEISPSFNATFTQENLRREQQRSGLLAVVFSMGLVLASGVYFLYIPIMGKPVMRLEISRMLITFLTFMALYEWNVWNILRFSLKKGLKITQLARFVNASFEVTALSLLMYAISGYSTYPVVVMLSPFPLFYFFLIILSTLRLNFWLSVYTGIVASVESLILSLFLLSRSVPMNAAVDPYLDLPFTYLIKSFILLLCGLCAGYVARQIQQSVRSSIEGIENQNQLIMLFGQQVSPEIAQVMIQQKGMLASTHMRVSVLFIDIRNFTKFADRHTADEVVTYQNAFFRIIVEVVNRYHGVVNQFLGDGCMVSFGAPIVLDNPAENAVKAGLEIIEEIKQAVKDKAMIPTTVGVGVHVGDAVIGNIGTETRQQFSITGNVVILAARIEQLNKEFDSCMLITQDVMNELTFTLPLAEPLGLVHVKGMDDGVFLYKLC